MTHLILFFGLLIVAYFSGSQAENALLQYWEKRIGLPQPPQWFVAKASPLSLRQIEVFMKLVDENQLEFHMQLFCRQANVACFENILVKKRKEDKTLPPIAQWNGLRIKYEGLPNETTLSVASQGGIPYFRESMVQEGCSINIPDLRDPVPFKSFLPQRLALKIPFTFAQLKELNKLFGVLDESNMGKYIQDTLEKCEKSPIQGEECTCATSVEDLIDFVVDKLGRSVHIWSTESVEGSYENVTIGALKLIHGNLSAPPTICHSQPFPFQVYYCHVFEKVKVYVVDIHTKKKVNHVIMACHYDTSTWNPDHLAFKVLGFGPGLIEVCHWINENGLIWTKTPS